MRPIPAMGMSILFSVGSAATGQTVLQPPQQPAPGVTAPPAETQKKWEVSTFTYFWAGGFKGDLGVKPDTEPVGVDLSFGDIFRHLKFVLMGAAEARHGRLVLIGDLVWVKLGASKSITIRDVDLLSGSLKSANLIVTAVGGYKIVAEGPLTIDLAAGGRLNGASMRLKLSGPRRSVDDKVTKTWVDPIIATRLTAQLAPKVSASLYGDMGGFGVSSRFTWQAWGLLNYQLSRKTKLSAGWRHYAVDYRKGSFLYDGHADGPIIGAVISF